MWLFVVFVVVGRLWVIVLGDVVFYMCAPGRCLIRAPTRPRSFLRFVDM